MSKSLYAAQGATSDEVTAQSNTTGELTPVVTIDPEDGTGIIFRNNGDVGKKSGIPIYARLRDSNGNLLGTSATVALGYEAPTDNSFNVVSNPKDNIASYNKKTITEQQNVDNVDSVKHDLDGSRVEVRDVDQFFILVEAGTQVDPAESEFYFEESYVEEVDIE